LLAVGLFCSAFPASAAAQTDSTIFTSLKGDLVKSNGKRLQTFDETSLAPVQYYAIYYSASWCGPCRAFTPDLVKWYSRNKSKNPHFELIFVSSDRSEDDMAAYMKEDQMEWPALAFDKKRSNRTLTKYAGSGIPCLVLVDSSGQVLSDSYVDGNYVGPRKVLEDIESTLKAHPASAEALSSAAAANPPSSSSAGASSFDDFFKKK